MLFKYLGKVNVLHWLLIMIGLFTVFSVAKVLAIVGVGITFLCLVVKYWDKVKFLLGGK